MIWPPVANTLLTAPIPAFFFQDSPNPRPPTLTGRAIWSARVNGLKRAHGDGSPQPSRIQAGVQQSSARGMVHSGQRLWFLPAAFGVLASVVGPLAFAPFHLISAVSNGMPSTVLIPVLPGLSPTLALPHRGSQPTAMHAKAGSGALGSFHMSS